MSAARDGQQREDSSISTEHQNGSNVQYSRASQRLNVLTTAAITCLHFDHGPQLSIPNTPHHIIKYEIKRLEVTTDRLYLWCGLSNCKPICTVGNFIMTELMDLQVLQSI